MQYISNCGVYSKFDIIGRKTKSKGERNIYRDNKRSVYCFPSALLSNLKVYLSSALAF